MRISSNTIIVIFLSYLMAVLNSASAQAQTIHFAVTNIALKNGESTELGDLYFISSNCKSLLTETPGIEILDGPPGVSVAIKQAMVVPRYYGCAKLVSGGKLVVSAKEIDEYSHTRMVVRITYTTKSGKRQRSHDINISLFP